MLKFDIKDVYSWSNAGEAKQYINKEGYFSDDVDELNREINENKLYPLKEVNSNSAICFVALSPVGRWSCGLFIPAEKVKEVEEKKYRPFTLEEFNKKIPMGTVFKYRYKGQKHIKSIYYHANLDCENGYQAVFFEDCVFDFDYCFGQMELLVNGKWQPFGVEE